MVSKQYPRLGETVFHEILENGLHIYVDRRRDFATNYGGMDMRFFQDGRWKDTPAGVAHFLEHKMFDTEDGNALQDLAANGASPNAFTSSAITGYYFESTEKFFDNLKILLSFVSVPYFTQESVDKEQGIIGQEIRMVEDDPENQVFYALMEITIPSGCPSPVPRSPSPTLPPAPSILATRPSITRPTWCSPWRATWTRSRCAPLPRRSCPRILWARWNGTTAGRRLPTLRPPRRN